MFNGLKDRSKFVFDTANTVFGNAHTPIKINIQRLLNSVSRIIENAKSEKIIAEKKYNIAFAEYNKNIAEYEQNKEYTTIKQQIDSKIEKTQKFSTKNKNTSEWLQENFNAINGAFNDNKDVFILLSNSSQNQTPSLALKILQNNLILAATNLVKQRATDLLMYTVAAKASLELKMNEETTPQQKRGGAPPTIQQAINSYMDDPELSPNIDKVNLRDRGIFIVLTFIIRALALFITEWAIYSGLINSFSKSFNMYFGVYLCIFILVLILTNSKNDDITFFNQLFYYVNVESEDGKGLIRILLQVLCIFFILPIPYIVKDFRLKDKSPNRVLSYADKSNIYSSVDKFTLFAWILTSIVALSV